MSSQTEFYRNDRCTHCPWTLIEDLYPIKVRQAHLSEASTRARAANFLVQVGLRGKPGHLEDAPNCSKYENKCRQKALDDLRFVGEGAATIGDSPGLSWEGFGRLTQSLPPRPESQDPDEQWYTQRYRRIGAASIVGAVEKGEIPLKEWLDPEKRSMTVRELTAVETLEMCDGSTAVQERIAEVNEARRKWREETMPRLLDENPELRELLRPPEQE